MSPGYISAGGSEVTSSASQGGVIAGRLRGFEKNAHASSSGTGTTCRAAIR